LDSTDPLAVESGIYPVDDLLRVQADGMNGGDNNQQEEYEQHRVLTDVLAFFPLNVRPKTTQHSLQSHFPRPLSRKQLSEVLRPGNFKPGRSPLRLIFGEVGSHVHGTKVTPGSEDRAFE
jgi:hypothetical protein